MPLARRRGRARTAFPELLINAGQALAPGAEAVLEAAVSDPEFVEVSIRDHGPGMATPQLARAGEPFYTSKAGGTGLGLSIAKKIAVAHGGDLRIESAPGDGTMVRVRLPIAPSV
ncbi:MAG: ATP-binding protein [Gemmatimonadales bacterium]